MAAHYHRRKKKSKNSNIELLFDFAAIIGPLVTLPQLIDIWNKGQDAGVSLVTWSGYLALSVFWLNYGIIKKEKPIIIANSLYLVINSIIVIGLLVL